MRRRARLASLRADSGVPSTIAAICANGTANTSCSTNASRSAGGSVSSTTNSAIPTASASIARCSGSNSPAGSTIGSGRWAAGSAPSRVRRSRNMFRQMRATTVVSQASRLAMSAPPLRSSRSQASCTASWASSIEPSMRYASAPSRGRAASNRAVRSAASGLVMAAGCRAAHTPGSRRTPTTRCRARC
ncbi:hypothetical protein N602_08435, partial [Mycobacterium avium subsp. hominissuis 10-5606]